MLSSGSISPSAMKMLHFSDDRELFARPFSFIARKGELGVKAL